MKDIDDWAKKAREELQHHRYYLVDDGCIALDDEKVIALCKEYDEIQRKILNPELCPTCNDPKDRNSIVRIIGEQSEGPLYCPNGFHNV